MSIPFEALTRTATPVQEEYLRVQLPRRVVKARQIAPQDCLEVTLYTGSRGRRVRTFRRMTSKGSGGTLLIQIPIKLVRELNIEPHSAVTFTFKVLGHYERDEP